jgi:hypothetical protein
MLFSGDVRANRSEDVMDNSEKPKENNEKTAPQPGAKQQPVRPAQPARAPSRPAPKPGPKVRKSDR